MASERGSSGRARHFYRFDRRGRSPRTGSRLAADSVPRILIVDGDPLIRNAAVRALAREGATREVASDGAEALNRLAKRVLIDLPRFRSLPRLRSTSRLSVPRKPTRERWRLKSPRCEVRTEPPRNYEAFRGASAGTRDLEDLANATRSMPELTEILTLANSLLFQAREGVRGREPRSKALPLAWGWPVYALAAVVFFAGLMAGGLLRSL